MGEKKIYRTHTLSGSSETAEDAWRANEALAERDAIVMNLAGKYGIVDRRLFSVPPEDQPRPRLPAEVQFVSTSKTIHTDGPVELGADDVPRMTKREARDILADPLWHSEETVRQAEKWQGSDETEEDPGADTGMGLTDE